MGTNWTDELDKLMAGEYTLPATDQFYRRDTSGSTGELDVDAELGNMIDLIREDAQLAMLVTPDLVKFRKASGWSNVKIAQAALAFVMLEQPGEFIYHLEGESQREQTRARALAAMVEEIEED